MSQISDYIDSMKNAFAAEFLRLIQGFMRCEKRKQLHPLIRNLRFR